MLLIVIGSPVGGEKGWSCAIPVMVNSAIGRRIWKRIECHQGCRVDWLGQVTCAIQTVTQLPLRIRINLTDNVRVTAAAHDTVDVRETPRLLAVLILDNQVAGGVGAGRTRAGILVERAKDMPNFVRRNRAHVVDAVAVIVVRQHGKRTIQVSVSKITIRKRPRCIVDAVRDKDRKRPIRLVVLAQPVIVGEHLVEIIRDRQSQARSSSRRSTSHHRSWSDRSAHTPWALGGECRTQT